MGATPSPEILGYADPVGRGSPLLRENLANTDAPTCKTLIFNLFSIVCTPWTTRNLAVYFTVNCQICNNLCTVLFVKKILKKRDIALKACIHYLHVLLGKFKKRL